MAARWDVRNNDNRRNKQWHRIAENLLRNATSGAPQHVCAPFAQTAAVCVEHSEVAREQEAGPFNQHILIATETRKSNKCVRFAIHLAGRRRAMWCASAPVAHGLQRKIRVQTHKNKLSLFIIQFRFMCFSVYVFYRDLLTFLTHANAFRWLCALSSVCLFKLVTFLQYIYIYFIKSFAQQWQRDDRRADNNGALRNRWDGVVISIRTRCVSHAQPWLTTLHHRHRYFRPAWQHRTLFEHNLGHHRLR